MNVLYVLILISVGAMIGFLVAVWLIARGEDGE